MRFLALAAVVALVSTDTVAEECPVPELRDRAEWRRAVRIEEAFECVINELERIKRERELRIKELEKQVADLRRRVPSEYLNTNGKVTSDPGRLIGKASIIVDSSRSGKPFSLPIAQDVVEELCAGKSCHIILAMTVSGVFSDNPIERNAIGPCNFSYDAMTGAWDRSDGCTEGRAQGTDGDGATATEGSEGDLILEAGQSCLLTDTEIKSRPGTLPSNFGPDRSKGLFLTSVPERRPDVKRPFQCTLEIIRTGMF